MPDTAHPLALNLIAEIRFNGGSAANAWPVFVWPALEASASGARIALYDPLDLLGALRRLPTVTELDPKRLEGQDPRTGPVVAATLFDERLADFVRRGGRALVVQRGPGRFAHQRVAFWREGITLFEDHEALEGCREVGSGSFSSTAWPPTRH